jgi:bifunctional DNA-binding transcriptional regulator/antitoxin component of YhaV-PrlF toxin-antitoxin module
MFGGVSTLSLDSKGRLAIPARHRERLLAEFSGRLVVTLDSPKFLLVYPEKNWLPVMEKLAALPVTHPGARAYARLLLGNAETLELDCARAGGFMESIVTWFGGLRCALIGWWLRGWYLSWRGLLGWRGDSCLALVVACCFSAGRCGGESCRAAAVSFLAFVVPCWHGVTFLA